MADRSKFAQSKSKWIKAKEFVGKRIKVKISSVEDVHYEASEGRPSEDRIALMFYGKEKGLLLNATNTKALCEAYGPDDKGWIGHEIGLSVVSYEDKGFGFGWVLKPLDVKEPEYQDLDEPAVEDNGGCTDMPEDEIPY